MGQWDSKSLSESQGHTGGVVPPEESPAQMPLSMMDGLGEGADLSAASFAPPRRTINSGVLLLAAVIGVGGAALYAMRVSGKVDMSDPSMAGVEKQIDQALKRLSGTDMKPAADAAELEDLFKDTDEVVAMFASDPTKKQVELENLQKNPFELYVDQTKPAARTPDQAAAEKSKAQRLEALRKELGAMKLQSLLSGGGNSLAVVAGKVIREGDKLGSFTVASITPGGVLLTAEGNTYTLAMEQPGEQGQAKR